MPAHFSNQLTQLLCKLSQHYRLIYKANPGNAGDGFIAAGTFDYLEARQINYTLFSDSVCYSPNRDVLLYGGGGNLIEGYYVAGRNFIEANLKNFHKVIVLPSTVFGYADFFTKNLPSLFICCREKTSYKYLMDLGYVAGKSLLLTHDMAFYFNKKNYINNVKATKEHIFCFRTDGESLSPRHRENNHDISFSWNGDYWHNIHFARNSTRSLVSFLEPYKQVSTDRLHIAILSSMLRKKVNFYPNIYYKNEAVYQHSLKNYFPDTQFIK